MLVMAEQQTDPSNDSKRSNVTSPREAARGRMSPIVWIGFGISFVFLYLFLRNVHWGELSTSLTQANYFYLIPALALWVLTAAIRAVRWQIMVRHLRPIPFLSLFSAVNIGFMATALLPARAGELVRAAVLGKKENLKVTSVFATIVVERILDLLTVVFFLVLALLYLPANGEHAETLDNLRFFGGLFAVVIAGAILFLAMLKVWPERVKQVLAPILRKLPEGVRVRIHGILDNFIEGLEMLSSWTEALSMAALSLLLWFSIGLINWTLSFAFGIEMSILGGCLIFVVTAFAIALPQAPSFIGVFHVAVETSLKLLSVTTTLAKSYAIVLWAVSILPPVALGFYFLSRDGLSLLELTKKSE